MIEFRIDADSAGQRLDKYLRRRLPNVPTSHLFKMVRTKKIRVNGKRCQPEQLLAEGDVLTLRGTEQALLGPPSAERAKPPPPPGAATGLAILLLLAHAIVGAR